MLSERTIAIVKATAPAFTADAESITRRLYALMFAGNPEVQGYFSSAHQLSGAQPQALASLLRAYAANIDDLRALGSAVELVSQKHCSLGIQPEHYPILGKHLLVAIRDVLGPAATDEVLAAWSEAYEYLARACIGRETAIYREQAADPGGWNGYRRFVVSCKRVDSEVVTSFYLRPADGGPLPAFKPGQYVTVKVDHPATPTAPRNYSLSDRPGLKHFRISVKRESNLVPEAPPGLISNYLHDQVREGNQLLIGPPCGEFTLEPNRAFARPIVFLAGGIGVTPLLSMLKTLAHHKVETPIFFVHASRSSREHALGHEIRMVASTRPNIQTHFRYYAPLADDLREGRCDSTGVVDIGLLRAFLPAKDAEYYLCGPKPFMAGLYRGLTEWGVDDSRIHLEFFGPKQEITIH